MRALRGHESEIFSPRIHAEERGLFFVNALHVNEAVTDVEAELDHDLFLAGFVLAGVCDVELA